MSSGAEVRARLAALPLLVVVLPWRCNFLALPRDEGGAVQSAVAAKEEAPASRVSSAPPRTPPVKVTTLPEEVVVKVIGVGQAAFLRCWARAQRIDPALSSTKVRLHIELDASGKVTSSQSDSDSRALSNCLAVVARQLPFPAPGTPAVVDLPLIFR
jgi:hypothetical protein